MGLPWPVLLVLADESGSQLLLGLAGAARLAPYVGLSWLSGRLADRRERAAILRLSLWSRTALLMACAAAMHAHLHLAAVLLATAAIAAGTPAYPALVAGMPQLAGPSAPRATSLLVTVEVGSFVVGPAVGGLTVGHLPVGAAALAGAACCAVAALLFRGTALPAPRARPHGSPGGVWRLVRDSRSARHALVVVATVNAILSAIGLALIELADHVWLTGEEGFGLGTAVLGFGALATPVLATTRAFRSARGCLLVLALVVAGFALLPTGAAVLMLGVVGAVSTCCENVATGVLQHAVSDDLRASILGLADSLMIAAAMVSALAAPSICAAIGPVSFVLLLALGAAGLALGQRSQRSRPLDEPVLL
jgi:MFS family permease